ncbi:hypothetical protein HOG98_07930 [bacterium]|nr:hypothetical protein [bacterium]
MFGELLIGNMSIQNQSKIDSVFSGPKVVNVIEFRNAMFYGGSSKNSSLLENVKKKNVSALDLGNVLFSELIQNNTLNRNLDYSVAEIDSIKIVLKHSLSFFVDSLIRDKFVQAQNQQFFSVDDFLYRDADYSSTYEKIRIKILAGISTGLNPSNESEKLIKQILIDKLSTSKISSNRFLKLEGDSERLTLLGKRTDGNSDDNKENVLKSDTCDKEVSELIFKRSRFEIFPRETLKVRNLTPFKSIDDIPEDVYEIYESNPARVVDRSEIDMRAIGRVPFLDDQYSHNSPKSVTAFYSINNVNVISNRDRESTTLGLNKHNAIQFEDEAQIEDMNSEPLKTRMKQMIAFDSGEGHRFSVEIPKGLASMSMAPILVRALHGDDTATQEVLATVNEITDRSKIVIESGSDYSSDYIEENLVMTVGRYCISLGSSYKGYKGCYGERNEDRLVLGDSIFAIDGLGGFEDGDKASKALVRAITDPLMANSSDEDIFRSARSGNWEGASEKASACMVSARITQKEGFPQSRLIEFGQVGDCNMVLFKRNKATNCVDIISSTKDEHFNIIDVCLNSDLTKKPVDVYFSEFLARRHIVSSTFSRNPLDTKPCDKYEPTEITLNSEEEYLLFSGSDGLFDNMLLVEIALVLESIGKSGENLSLPSIFKQVKEIHELRFEEEMCSFIKQNIADSKNWGSFFKRCVKDKVPLFKLEGFPSCPEGETIVSVYKNKDFLREVKKWIPLFLKRESEIKQRLNAFNEIKRIDDKRLPSWYALSTAPKSDNFTFSVSKIH